MSSKEVRYMIQIIHTPIYGEGEAGRGAGRKRERERGVRKEKRWRVNIKDPFSNTWTKWF